MTFTNELSAAVFRRFMNLLGINIYHDSSPLWDKFLYDYTKDKR